MFKNRVIFIIIGILIIPLIPLKADSSNLIDLQYAGSVLWRNLRDFEIRGDYAYLSFRDGLMIMDISNPNEPAIISKMALQGEISRQIEVVGDYAYIANGSNGLRIIDISGPSNLELISSFKGEFPYLDVYTAQIHNNFFYGAAYAKGCFLLALDVSDPYNPIFTDTFYVSLPFSATNIADNYFYTVGDRGLGVFDISNPAEPESLSYLINYGELGRPLPIFGNYMYTTHHVYDLTILDISDASNPIPVNIWTAPNQIFAIEADENYVYLGIYNLGMLVVDISNPNDPAIAGQVTLDRFLPPSRLQKSGNYLYGSSRYGAEIFDVSDPQAPELISITPGPGGVFAADVRGDYAFIAEDGAGFSILDISDPDIERRVYNWDSASQVIDVKVKDNYAYALDDNVGLIIFDISDPENPVHISGLDCSREYADRFTIWGDYAFICAPKYYSTGGFFRLINISNPNAPFEQSVVDLGGYPRGSAVKDNYVYVGNEETFQLVDISDPQSPTLVQNFPLDGDVVDIKISGNIAYILQSEELSIFEISDPLNPQYITGYSMPAEPNCLTLRGNYVFIGLEGDLEGVESLIILNLNNPEHPYLAADYDYPWGCVYDVSIQDDNIYLAAYTAFITLTADLNSINYGDANSDGIVNVSDAVYIINYVFVGGNPPMPYEAGDVNCDGFVNVSDAVYIINFVFVGGPPPGDCQK